MSKLPPSSSDEDSDSQPVQPKRNDPSGSDDEDDDETDCGPLLVKPKGKTKNKSDTDDDEDEEEEESEKKYKEPDKKIETEDSDSDDVENVVPYKITAKKTEDMDSDDDSDESTTVANIVQRKKSKWSEDEDDDDDTTMTGIHADVLVIGEESWKSDERTDSRISINNKNTDKNLHKENNLILPVNKPKNSRGPNTMQEDEDILDDLNSNNDLTSRRISEVSLENTNIMLEPETQDYLGVQESPIIIEEKNSETDLNDNHLIEEEENSEIDLISQSSLAELMEKQIDNWYKEDGYVRPSRQSKKTYDVILQDGIDISDLGLNNEDNEKLTWEIQQIKNLSLEDLLYKIDFYD